MPVDARGPRVTSRFLLGGGCVLTLGARTPNFKQADVLMENGVIAEVGSGLRVRDAEHVDATDTIVMPGFVDTHRHAWTSLFHNLDEPGTDEHAAPSAAPFEQYGPDDVYAATLIGLLGAAEAGITTVVDWSPADPDDGTIEAALQAHADAGVRTVFVHAPAGTGGLPPAPELAGRAGEVAGPSTVIAFGAEVPRPDDVGAVAARWARVREFGLRIHAHAGSEFTGRGSLSELGRHGLLGGDLTLVHCSDLEGADLQAVAGSATAVSLAPSSHTPGVALVQQLVDHGIRPGLGVGDERVSPGDAFARMRATISLQHATVFELKLAGKAGLPKLMSTRDVIRYATADGARVAGLGGLTGSLEPGMQADVIVLRTDRPNIYPVNDPIGAVVWGMDTSNVDWVFVGGRVVMRDGVLEADVARARAAAAEARRRVAGASGLVLGPTVGAA
jgi:5-methylthioadenosine/S-adenosylhomocysteine deaminase